MARHSTLFLICFVVATAAGGIWRALGAVDGYAVGAGFSVLAALVCGAWTAFAYMLGGMAIVVPFDRRRTYPRVLPLTAVAAVVQGWGYLGRLGAVPDLIDHHRGLAIGILVGDIFIVPPLFGALVASASFLFRERPPGRIGPPLRSADQGR